MGVLLKRQEADMPAAVCIKDELFHIEQSHLLLNSFALPKLFTP